MAAPAGNEHDLQRTLAARTAELEQTNRELAAVKARYDDLVRRIPHGVYVLRVPVEGARRFEYVSPQFCAMLGLGEQAILADSTLVFRDADPGDLAVLRAIDTSSLEPGRPLSWEGRFRLRGGERWLRLEAERTWLPGGDHVWSGVVSDVTERRAVQDRLRQSEELYRELHELAPNAITVADGEGRILTANRPALQLFGEARVEDAVGRSVFDWVAPDGLALARERFVTLLETSRLHGIEMEFVRAGGEVFTGLADLTLVRDEAGRPRLVIVMVTDLTQRRLMEAERLRLQKLEAIGTLAGGLAHDFNNLLQGVFGYISLARLKLDDPEGAAAMLAQAEKATGQAVSLTSQLLTFAKGGKPQKSRLALPPVVERAAHFALSGASTVCVIDGGDDLWDADADEGQVIQVVQNIVMNASQAMQQSGIVRLGLRNVELAPGTDEALPGGGRFVEIRVADAGIGIAAPYLSRIFDPYFTTKQRGSGLGLATAWSIVARHGGTIRVASTPGLGTTFEVLLPAAAPAPAVPPPPPVDVAAPACRRRRVLVMDDEELVRSVAAAMIASLGHQVDEAVDGEEAVLLVERALAAGAPYDIVILDLTVRGGMGGGEAIGRIRAATPGVRAVVSSGYSDSAVVADFRAHGFDASLDKPYTIEALRDILAAIAAG